MSQTMKKWECPTGHLKACSHWSSEFASTSPSKFDIVSIAVQTLTQGMDMNRFRPILCVYVCVIIEAMLNFDGVVEANADVKYERSITHCVLRTVCGTLNGPAVRAV